jgi:carbon-monoxide dehydrogenase medium subunit
MLVEIRVPLHPNSGSAYLKVDRRVGDWAVVAVGAALTLDAGGQITQAGLALVAVGADITAREAEAALIGQRPTAETFARAAQLARSACEPVTDQRGSADYKRHVVGVLTGRVLKRAAERALPKKEE